MEGAVVFIGRDCTAPPRRVRAPCDRPAPERDRLRRQFWDFADSGTISAAMRDVSSLVALAAHARSIADVLP